MEDGEPAASPQPERLDEEPEKRLTYAANLLEDNAALVFKLNGTPCPFAAPASLAPSLSSWSNL